METIIVNES